MVLNQSNIMYLPPSKVIAAGTDKRNLMQGGLQKTWEQDLDERIDFLTYKIDKLLQTEQNIKQAGVKPEPTPEEQRNIRVAGIINKASDREMLDAFMAFTNGDRTGGHTPPCIATVSDQPLQQNLKQGGIKKPTSDYEMLRTFAEFSGLL